MSNRNLGEDQKAAVIRQDIERTRAEMSRTVDEIEHRLSPAHLKEQVADLKDTVVDQFHQAKEQIKNDLKGDLLEAKGVVREEIADVKTAAYDATVGKAKHMVDDAKETVSHALGGARETVTHAAYGARDTVTTAGSTVLGTIRANPIPAAMVAVGLGWLLMGARSRSVERRLRYAQPYGGEELDLYAGYVGDPDVGYQGYLAGPDMVEESRYEGGGVRRRGVLRRGKEALSSAAGSVQGGVSNVGHKVGDVGQKVGEKVASAGHRVSEGATQLVHGAADVAHRVGDRAGNLAHEARGRAVRVAGDARDMSRRAVRGAGHQLHRAEATMEVAYGDNPLAFGALAFAAGAAVGLALPHTEREDLLLGEAKEQLLQKAQLAARDALHQAEDKVGQIASVAGKAKDVLHEADSKLGDMSQQRLGGLETEVKSSIGKQI